MCVHLSADTPRSLGRSDSESTKWAFLQQSLVPHTSRKLTSTTFPSTVSRQKVRRRNDWRARSSPRSLKKRNFGGHTRSSTPPPQKIQYVQCNITLTPHNSSLLDSWGLGLENMEERVQYFSKHKCPFQLHHHNSAWF